MKTKKRKIECVICDEEKQLCEPIDCDELLESKNGEE